MVVESVWGADVRLSLIFDLVGVVSVILTGMRLSRINEEVDSTLLSVAVSTELPNEVVSSSRSDFIVLTSSAKPAVVVYTSLIVSIELTVDGSSDSTRA